MSSALILFCFFVPGSFCFLLESNTFSYAQFRKWNVALNGTLEFEFKTHQPNGLLLYTDDGGTYDFFEIKLVEGALRLRYNLGGGAQIITIGRELNDGRWHKVSVKRNDNRTTLSVDDDKQSRTSKGKEFQFGNVATNSDVYVGGMPSWYNTKLTRLALPSVIFEPRFSGAVRNLVYTDSESILPKRQRIKRSSRRRLAQAGNSSVSVSSTDICETEDPCQNDGICITTDSGPVCDCHNVEFEGTYCEKEKTPSEATFYGKEYLEYNLNVVENEAAATTQESISFSFRTKYANGFLFHAGNKEDYLNIVIKDGGISVLMKVTSGKLDLYIKPNRVRFDDYRWHKVIVHRRIKEISAVTSFCRVTLTVDTIYSEHASTAGTFTMLSSSKLYVGGSAHTRALPGSSTNQNFVGCLRKMLYEIDSSKIDIFETAKSGSKLVSIGGQMSFNCTTSDASDAISFTTPDSYLVLPDWEAAQSGMISIKFRTNEPHGLLIFSSSKGSFKDVFAVELIEGQLYMIMDLGAGAVKEQVGMGKMNDGLWHSVIIHREGRNGRVAVDGFGIEFSLPGESRQLDLGSGLFLGGIPWHRMANEKFPISIWSGVLKLGYVGCIRDLIINDELVSVLKYAEQQDLESVEPVCRTNAESPCTSNPCFNQGECIPGWNRFTCDCSKTQFGGPTCSKISPTLHFNGTQNVLVDMPANTTYQVEHLSIRFKTVRPAGLLFAASDRSGDRIEIGVFGGKIRLSIQINHREKAVVNADQLNDNSWHTVKYMRYGAFLLVQVDNRRSIKVENVFTEFDIIHVNHIHIGGYTELPDDQLPLISARLPKFIGAIQRIVFNGIDLIEMSQTSYLHQDDPTMPQVRSNALYAKEESDQMSHRAFTILSKLTFIGLSPFKLFSSLNIYFQFKTKEPNGLIVYSGGKRNDYLAVELASGHIYVLMQMGEEMIKIKDGAKSSFSDNRWHTVSIRQPTYKIYTLQVDDIVVAAMKHRDVEDTLQLSGILYVAGLPNEVRSVDGKLLRSKHGFQGCLVNMHLNGESPDLIRDALLPSTLISAGCEGSGKRCNHNTCDNRGVCVPQWNSQICDCSMTSYTGATCSEESIAYEFGPGSGLITYTFPEDRRPEMKGDVLAAGFMTDKDDAVLFRVESSGSVDYLQLEILEGNIFVVYNMGTNDQPIGEIGTKINDNSYHIVRFKRNGANASFQLDDYNEQTIFPAGHQLSVFNTQSTIQVGGKWNRLKQRVERPFGGVMAGLVFNGQRILDLAFEKDGRTETRGDVNRVMTIKNRARQPESNQYQQMQPTPTVDQTPVTDDLIFSGAGSGCNVDDEDHCRVINENSPDDLITPVYVSSTPRSHKPKSKPKPKLNENDMKQCDDEDCDVEGSGEFSNRLPPETISSTETNIFSEYSIPTGRAAFDGGTESPRTGSASTLPPFVARGNLTSTVPIVTVVSVGMVPVQQNTSTNSIDMFPFYGILNETMKKVKHKLEKIGTFLASSSSTSTSTTTTAATTTSGTREPSTKSTAELSSATSTATPRTTPATTTITTTTTTTTTSTTRRFFTAVPPRPPIDHTRKGGMHETGAAITIIVISAILIVIIVITILVLLFSRKNQTNYKIESHKSFATLQSQSERKQCSQVLLPNEPSHLRAQQTSLLLPSSNDNMRIVGKVKKRQDVKEWYV